MFDRLIDFILSQITHLVPIATIHEYQGGVMYRFGRYRRSLTPGWYFKFPYINTYARDTVVDTTILLPAQSVTTKDRKLIVVKGSVGFRITDFSLYFNKVYDTKSAISDRCCVLIKDLAVINTAAMIRSDKFDITLTQLLQEQVDQYGIDIQYAALIDITESTSYRLFNEKAELL
jgi:regulator of protease activity HflC (stomatin/prohibitin superfamily)